MIVEALAFRLRGKAKGKHGLYTLPVHYRVDPDDPA